MYRSHLTLSPASSPDPACHIPHPPRLSSPRSGCTVSCLYEVSLQLCGAVISKFSEFSSIHISVATVLTGRGVAGQKATKHRTAISSTNYTSRPYISVCNARHIYHRSLPAKGVKTNCYVDQQNQVRLHSCLLSLECTSNHTGAWHTLPLGAMAFCLKLYLYYVSVNIQIESQGYAS